MGENIFYLRLTLKFFQRDYFLSDLVVIHCFRWPATHAARSSVKLMVKFGNFSPKIHCQKLSCNSRNSINIGSDAECVHYFIYARPWAYREIHHIYLEFVFIITIIVISRNFDFMGRGDFILYKNSERYFEVRPYYSLKIMLLSTLIWPYYLKYSMPRYISFSRHSALNLMTSPLSRIMNRA